MVDEDPELEPTLAGFPDDEPEPDPEQVEFYVANPAEVAASVEHVAHWLEDRSICALVGMHTVRYLRVLVSHAEQSLAAIQDPD